MYRQKQAGRVWYQHLARNIMKDLGLTYYTVDKSVSVYRQLNTSGSGQKVNQSYHRGHQESQTDPDSWGRSAVLPWGQHRKTIWWGYQPDADTSDRSNIYWLAPFQWKGKRKGHFIHVIKSFEETFRTWATRWIFWPQIGGWEVDLPGEGIVGRTHDKECWENSRKGNNKNREYASC